MKRVVVGYEDSNFEEFNMVMKWMEERFKINFFVINENCLIIMIMDKKW